MWELFRIELKIAAIEVPLRKTGITVMSEVLPPLCTWSPRSAYLQPKA